MTCVKKKADRYETLASFIKEGSKSYNHVVILGSALGDDAENDSRVTREEDSKTLATLMYVNDLLEKQRSASKKTGKPTVVTVEFLNEGVATMAKEEGNVTNAILPQALSSKIAAQTVRDFRLNEVWRELLSQKGREVYLRPAGSYKQIAGERMSFASVSDALATSNDDIVIGFIPRHSPRVKINPQEGERYQTRIWDKRDTLIVLSEE